MKKQITIIGASAGVGLLCLKQALARGHKVISLSRGTDSLPKHPNLISIKGSATNAEDIKKAIANSDAVIVAIGTGKSMKATDLYTDFAKTLIAVQAEIKTTIPFIILTGFGTGDSSQYQGFFIRTIMKILLGAIYKNKTKMEEMIAESSIKWGYVRPGMLTDGVFTGKYKVVTDYNKAMRINKIARADVANYMLNQAENPTDLGKYPALSY